MEIKIFSPLLVFSMKLICGLRNHEKPFICRGTFII